MNGGGIHRANPNPEISVIICCKSEASAIIHIKKKKTEQRPAGRKSCPCPVSTAFFAVTPCYRLASEHLGSACDPRSLVVYSCVPSYPAVPHVYENRNRREHTNLDSVVVQ